MMRQTIVTILTCAIVSCLLHGTSVAQSHNRNEDDMKPETRRKILDAQKLLKEGKVNDALSKLKNLLAKEEEANPIIYFVLGNAYYSAKDYAQAVAAYKKAIEAKPDYSEVHRNLGRAYAAVGNHKQAVQHLSAGIASYEKETEILILIGKCNLLINNHEGAEAAFKRVLMSKPADKQALLLLARSYLGQKRPEAAERAAEKLLKHFPDEAQAILLLAESLMQQEQYEEAADVLEVLRLDGSTNQVALKALGDVYVSLGMPREALNAYKQIEGDKGLSGNDLLRLGYAFQAAELLEEAVEVFEKALFAGAPKAETHLALAQVLVDMGKADSHDKAILNARKAIEQGCSLGEASIILGRAYLAKEKYLEAAAQFKQASTDYSTASSGWAWLGQVEELQGSIAEALKCYREALRLNPANEDLYTTVRRLQEQSLNNEQ
jgi:tetratricopeptide (TPR) repeat protein